MHLTSHFKFTRLARKGESGAQGQAYDAKLFEQAAEAARPDSSELTRL